MTARQKRLLLYLLAGLLLWGWFDVRRRARYDPAAPGKHHTDITVYTVAADALADGRDPYTVTNPQGWHYLYPPLFAILISPLRHLAPENQAFAWFLASLLMAFGCWVEVRALQARLAIPRWFCVAASLAALLPILNTLQRGQVGLLILYALLLGFHLSLDRPFLGALVLALPVAIKLSPVVPVGILMLQLLLRRGGSARFLAASGGLAAGLLLCLLLLPTVAIGWARNEECLRTWASRVILNEDVGEENEFFPRATRNQSLSNALYRAGLLVLRAGGWEEERPIDRVIWSHGKTPLDNEAWRWGIRILRVLLSLSMVLLTVSVRNGGAAPPFGLACLLSLLLSPISWGHHYTILLPAVLFVPPALPPRVGRALAVSAILLVLLHYAARKITGPMGLLGIGAGIWYVVAAWKLHRARRMTCQP